MHSLKLPNFFDSSTLNSLKNKMGIAKEVYGNFGQSQLAGIKIKLETTGIDIEDISDVITLDDYTLTYKGERVILYIRDVYVNAHRNVSLPKFHVSNCKTLQNMIESGRKKRYVVSQKESNKFNLNFISGQSVRKEEHSLNVCKNCLQLLRWDNYSTSWSAQDKDQCVSNFSIKEFFIKYPKPLMRKTGFSASNADYNRYADNWASISRMYKESKNWTCEQCHINLTHRKPLLHTHHINGQKNENQASNLRALCVACHAQQPMHEYMYSIPTTVRAIKEIELMRKDSA